MTSSKLKSNMQHTRSKPNQRSRTTKSNRRNTLLPHQRKIHDLSTTSSNKLAALTQTTVMSLPMWEDPWAKASTYVGGS